MKNLICAVTASLSLASAGHAGTLCPGDCTVGGGDGTVGISDFLVLLAQWGGPGTCDIDGGGVGITDFLNLLALWGTDPQGPPDFNSNGVVDINDFLELLAHWGPCP